jgi:hypothetical protein
VRWFLVCGAGLGLLGLMLVLLSDDDAAQRVPAPRFEGRAAPLSVPRPDATPAAVEREAAPGNGKTDIHVHDRTWRARNYEFLQRTIWPADPSTVPQLAAETHWVGTLKRFAGLPEVAGPAAQLDRFDEALGLATDPRARQNLIFLVALSLPFDVAEPWLEELRAGDDAADAEDALCALAFSLVPGAMHEFEAFAVDEAIASTPWPLRRGHAPDLLRRLLRSYRCLEVLDRTPYYKRVYGMVRVPFTAHPRPDAAAARRVRAAWLRRFAGHPGSDDTALRIALSHQAEGDHVEAARWFARAASLPDHDKLGRAAFGLVSTCELALTPGQIDVLAHDRGLDTPNRAIMQYVRLRRVAAERGCAEALAVAEGVAGAEPTSLIAYAWRNRLAAPVPRGLDSGLVPLPANDPLRRLTAREERAPVPDEELLRGRSGLVYRWMDDEEEKRKPWPEAFVIDADVLMRQLRAWETLAALESRARIARRKARADLLYKQAAVLYHDRDVFFPAYGRHTDNFRGVIRRVYYRAGKTPALAAALDRFERRSFAWLRAVDLFRAIEREAPDYAAMDKVLFSQGLALRRLLDYLPYKRDRTWQRGMIRDVVTALERCAREFPDSPLAPDARRAVAYWRANRPDAFP